MLAIYLFNSYQIVFHNISNIAGEIKHYILVCKTYSFKKKGIPYSEMPSGIVLKIIKLHL